MNKVIFTGRIANDLEVKVTPSNKHVLEFDLAVRKTKEKSSFFKVQCWEARADYLQSYATKGTLIGVVGTLEENRYVNKEQKTVKDIYVLVENVEILSSPKQPSYQPTLTNDGRDMLGHYENSPNVAINADELPFY